MSVTNIDKSLCTDRGSSRIRSVCHAVTFFGLMMITGISSGYTSSENAINPNGGIVINDQCYEGMGTLTDCNKAISERTLDSKA